MQPCRCKWRGVKFLKKCRFGDVSAYETNQPLRARVVCAFALDVLVLSQSSGLAVNSSWSIPSMRKSC
eukprot:4355813-Pleurochrysis_carterae.AAC.1